MATRVALPLGFRHKGLRLPVMAGRLEVGFVARYALGIVRVLWVHARRRVWELSAALIALTGGVNRDWEC